MNSPITQALNREGWLTEVGRQMEPLFRGFRIAPYRVTCGWPCVKGLSRRAPRVGECHSLESSAGGFHEIFISPLLAEPLEVAGTLCHELAHVVAGIKAGHKGEFIKVCRYVGLTKGKPSCVMPGSLLKERLSKLISKLGEYPHTALRPVGKAVKVSTIIGLRCGACGCKVSISRKWLEQAGIPTCGCGREMVPTGVNNDGEKVDE